MKKLRKRIFAAVLAALMLTTAMPGTALYASAETGSVSENAIGQAGTEDTAETVDGDTEETETDDAEETGDGDTDEPAQEPPTGPLEEDSVKCICETLCTGDSINEDCPVCGAEDADLSACKGKEQGSVPEKDTEDDNVDTGICKHHQEHDADCGYIPKSENGEGSPCTYECRICPVEDLIADLPDKVTKRNEFRLDNAEELRAQLDKILDLYRELTEDEQEQIDMSRCYALQEALATANVPALVEEGTPDLELFGQKVYSGDSGDGWSYASGVLTLENFHSDNSSEDFIHVTNVDLEFTLYVKGDNSVKTSGKLIWGSVYGSMTITGEQGASLSLDGKSWSDRYISINGVTMDVTMQEMIFLAYDMEIDNATVSFNMSGSSGYIYTTHGSFTVKNGSDVTITNSSGVVDYCVATNKAEITDSTLKIINPSGFGMYVTKLSQQASEYKASVTNSTILADVLDAAVHCEEEMSVANSQLTGSGKFLLRSKKGITVDNSSRMEGIIYEFFESDTGAVYQIYGSHILAANLTVAENGFFAIPEGAALTIPDGVTLENNGAMRIHEKASLTGTGALTGSGKFLIDVNEDMISIPEDLTYTGVDYTDQITLEGSTTVCGTAFTADTGGWTRNIVPAVVKDAGEYTVTFTKGDKKISKTFTVEQSGTDLKSEGRVLTYNGDTQTTTFSADDTITVKATPIATGTAPQKAAARLQGEPGAGQMALYVGNTLVSSQAVDAGADGTYTMTVSAADVLFAAGGPGTEIPLTAKFAGNDNMADGAGTVKVSISAAAVAKKDGVVIGYYGESNLADAFAEDSGNDGATITLLDNITTSKQINVYTDNLTLDLNGKTYTCTQNDFQIFFVSLTIKGSGAITTSGFYCLVVDEGTLNIESGSFSAKESAVYVVNDGTLQLTGGSFTGGQNAIKYASGEVTEALKNYGGADAPHYAFYEGGQPHQPTGSSLPSGTFTVKECRHTGIEVTNLGGGKHGLTCPYCGYSYSHDSTTLTTLIATANQTANTVTLSEGCDIADCDYKLTVGTVSFAFPKAVYGQTDQAVTLTGIPADYIIICQAEGGDQIQNQDGDTEMSLTLKDLFGSTEITAGDHKLSVWFGGGTTGTFSNKCELTFTIAKADQTPLSITGAPGSVTYGDTFQLGISGGSGTGSVSWAASGATVDDVGNVIITRAGFVVITAMKEGDSNYTGIEGRITLNVNTASLTVTANDQTIAYGGHIEEGKEQVTVSGLCGSDTLTDITLTPSMENVPGGTGTIMPSAAKIQNGSGGDAAANYEITYKTGTLTIGKIQNAPGMPSAVMDNVSNSCQKISDVPLPDGWVWQDSDKNTALEVGVPVSAVAVYNGADSDYYENVTVTVTVTRIACDHTEGEILYTGDGESAPTCTKAGLGHTVCTKCGAVVRKDIAVSALGHDYDAGEVTKEPTAEAEGERTYTCKRCGHTYTETIPRKEPQGLWIGHMQPSVSYTGTAVKQEQIEVYYGTALLREKVDYTISYKDNTNAGTAQVIVTGKGNYTGKAVETFEIQPIDIGAQPGMTAIVATAVETGKTLKPAVTVTWNGKKLKEKTDYTLSYHTSIKTAGEYEVSISGKQNYTGSMAKTFSVKPRGTKLLKSAAVSGIKKSYPYSGSGLASDLQSMVVKMGKTTLVKGTDYIVRTENTDVVGTGTVIIEAAQADAYAGEKRIAVSITGTDLRKGSIKGVEKSYPYTGRPITPQITVYSGRNGTGEVIPADKYTVSYTNSTEQGKATVTATGIPEKGYSGSVKVSYQIGRLNLADEKAAGNLKVIMPADISHAKGGAKPQPVITFTYGGVTRTLREGADYTLKYSNHTTATGSKPPTVKITGKGNYSGNITESFAISKQDIGRLSITVTDRAYGRTRKGSYYCSAPKVYDLDGKQLKSGRDYTVQYTYADSGQPIGRNDKPEIGTKLCAVVTAHEGSSYTGTLSAVYVVREATEVKDIGKVKNDKIENQQYTGSALKPEVRLYTQTGKTKTYLTDEDCEVIGCYNNTKRGTATILVRGKGVYSGVKRITFRIVQKKIR